MEGLKVLSENKESGETEAAFVDDNDIYAMICRMSALNGALTALNDGILNEKDAEDTLSGCEYISRDLISNLRDWYERVTK